MAFAPSEDLDKSGHDHPSLLRVFAVSMKTLVLSFSINDQTGWIPRLI